MRFFASLLLLALCACAPPPPETLAHGRFAQVELYRTRGAPTGFALLLADTPSAAATAQQLARGGTAVALIDTAAFIADLEHDGGGCVYPSGDLENLSRYVQAYAHLPAYFPPVLAGIGAGASLAYAALLQAPAGAFAGAVTPASRAPLTMHKPLCAGESVARKAVTIRAQNFAAQIAQLAARAAPGGSLPAAVADLPIVEVHAAANAPSPDIFAVLISGDGGWAGLDKNVAGALAARGIPVVGVDSLRYFWGARTPENTAVDIERLIEFYVQAWRKPRVLLIGYSQGGDVLPFIYNRLSGATRARVQLLIPIALEQHAAFEFHMTNWVGGKGDQPTLPEVQKLAGNPALLCIYGADETDALCAKLDGAQYRKVMLPGAHHFNGDYDRLAATILAAVPSNLMQ